MNKSLASRRARRSAYTLVETLIAVHLLVLVMAGTMKTWLSFNRGWNSASISTVSTQALGGLLEELVYGKWRGDAAFSTFGLRAAEKETVRIFNWDNGSWQISYNHPGEARAMLQYDAGALTLRNANLELAEQVTDATLVEIPNGVELHFTVRVSRGGKTLDETFSTSVIFRN